MKNTIKNLAKAFIGESQARNRYTFYAKTAKKEGYPQLEEIFLLTAENEKEHAKWLMRMINDLKKKSEGSPEELKALEVEADAP
ncbi:MAG TPA: ferritin family protein, partial [Patescibacteria group bacterium]|nr:ferritin family protein [Patescibacteria group bacterium]